MIPLLFPLASDIIEEASGHLESLPRLASSHLLPFFSLHPCHQISSSALAAAMFTFLVYLPTTALRLEFVSLHFIPLAQKSVEEGGGLQGCCGSWMCGCCVSIDLMRGDLGAEEPWRSLSEESKEEELGSRVRRSMLLLLVFELGRDLAGGWFSIWLVSCEVVRVVAARGAAVQSWVRLGRVELLFVVSVVRILRPRFALVVMVVVERKEEGGRRKEEGGRRKEERGGGGGAPTVKEAEARRGSKRKRG
ncbi:hypothetical protein Droror1_Dr00023454 [Drosera rotundifolia]